MNSIPPFTRLLFITAFAALIMPSTLLAANTLLVTKTLDSSDGSCDLSDCSLREAMAAANSGDMIEFSTLFDTAQTIALNGSNLAFSSNVTLKGPGRDLLTISGMQQSRVFLVPIGYSVAISGLTVRDGNASLAGGGIASAGYLELKDVAVVNNRSSTSGGGVIVTGSFNLQSVTIEGNQGQSGGGLCITSSGGGSIQESTVRNNTASKYGGGIYNDRGVLTLIASTVSGNFIPVNGSFYTSGGIDNSVGTIEIRNSTISGNRTVTAAASAGGLWSSGPTKIFGSTITDNSVPIDSGTAAGIVMFDTTGTLAIRNSIVASASHVGSTREIVVLDGASTVSQGFNLIGDPGNVVFAGSFDQVGTAASPLNPMLMPLANNGGPTQTHELQEFSTAIDRGSSFGLTRDQRGSERPVDDLSISNASDGADIGAYERIRDMIFQYGFESRSE